MQERVLELSLKNIEPKKFFERCELEFQKNEMSFIDWGLTFKDWVNPMFPDDDEPLLDDDGQVLEYGITRPYYLHLFSRDFYELKCKFEFTSETAGSGHFYYSEY